MIDSSASLLVLFIFSWVVSAYGWGRIAAGLIFRRPFSISYSIVFGIAIWILLGGALNIMGMVSLASVSLIIGAGLVMAVTCMFLNAQYILGLSIGNKITAASIAEGLPVLLIIVAAAYLFFPAIPANAFNFHDDFHTYFVYPFRMLQTGTAFVRPFDLLGTGTLGSQSFLQAFLLAWFPVDYINIIEPALFYVLSGLIINDIGKKTGFSWMTRVVVLLAFTIINPQYVNIAPLYSASLMTLGLVYSTILYIDSCGGSREKTYPLTVIPVVLFAAILPSLKLTLLIFSGVYVALFILFVYFLDPEKRNYIFTVLASLAAFTAFLLPWIWFSLQEFIGFIVNALNKLTVIGSGQVYGTPDIQGPMSLLSDKKLFWGGNYNSYGFVLFSSFLSALIAIYYFLKNKNDRDTYLIVSVIIVLSALISILALFFLVRPDLAIRYSIPCMIAVFPASFLLLGNSINHNYTDWTGLRISTIGIVILASHMVVIWMFGNDFMERVEAIYKSNSLVSFPVNEHYINYNEKVLGAERIQYVRKIQENIPQGGSLFAWMSTPFLLDFARNNIVVLDTPGINRLAKNVSLIGQEGVALDNYLLANGINYVIWEYNSLGMRHPKVLESEAKGGVRKKSAEYNLALIKKMNALMKSKQIVYMDSDFSVIDLGGVIKQNINITNVNRAK